MADYDLVIRNGSIADGSGADLFDGDVAIRDGKIVAVGKVLGVGDEEIDAQGKLVTPGFVDIHTHYDGQVTWDDHLSPSSNHGVTTVLMGNCGVGFAPCRPDQRAIMIDVMEGVEDIPGIVMAEGLPWNWTTFPEYMDALDARRMDIDFGVQVPHIPVRVYVMGKRGVAREPARTEDIRQMAALVREGLEAGALGFSSSRSAGHRTASGDVVPSTTASEDELLGIGLAMKAAGKGLFMTATDFDTSNGTSAEFALLRRIAEASGRPSFFPLLQYNEAPHRWFEIAEACAEARRHGADMYGQVVGRPVGLLYGLELTSHPFSGCPSYRQVMHLPLPERVKALRDPALRARIVSEEATLEDERVLRLARSVDEMYPMGDPPNYSPSADDRLDNIGARTGRTALEVAYDEMLEHEGKGLIYHPARNFTDFNLDVVLQMLKRDDTILGLGDGGAHLGRICDGSMPSFMLTYWCRDRQGERLSLPWTVMKLTKQTAELGGFHDRGQIRVGYKGDLNVIDFDNLTLHAPHAVQDLPAGGTRLFQEADGYVATVLSGHVTFRDGKATGLLPGRLVRGAQPSPAPAIP
jgi:N-acyl-D-aspartate/D-glutamate deacylase